MLPEHRLGCALEITAVEVQFDSAVGVAVGHAKKALVDPANDVELLEELAAKRLLVVLMRVALPPGKFPIPGEVGAGRAEGQEKFAVTFDNGGDDDDRAEGQTLEVPRFTVQITTRRTLEPCTAALSRLDRHLHDEFAAVIADLVVIDAEVELTISGHRYGSRDVADGERRRVTDARDERAREVLRKR